MADKAIEVDWRSHDGEKTWASGIHSAAVPYCSNGWLILVEGSLRRSFGGLSKVAVVRHE
jgi:hypothetical protein